MLPARVQWRDEDCKAGPARHKCALCHVVSQLIRRPAEVDSAIAQCLRSQGGGPSEPIVLRENRRKPTRMHACPGKRCRAWASDRDGAASAAVSREKLDWRYDVMACLRSRLAIAFFTGTASMVFDDMAAATEDWFQADRRAPFSTLDMRGSHSESASDLCTAEGLKGILETQRIRMPHPATS